MRNLLFLVSILVSASLGGCIDGNARSVTVPPITAGAVATYEGFGLGDPVDLQVTSGEADPSVLGMALPCVRVEYHGSFGNDEVCLTAQTYEPLRGSFAAPSANGSTFQTWLASPPFNGGLYLAFQAAGRTWASGDTMQGSWYGTPLTFKATRVSGQEVEFEIQFVRYEGESSKVTPVRFAMGPDHPFPLWFGAVYDELATFRPWARLTDGSPGSESLDVAPIDWSNIRNGRVQYEGHPPDGAPCPQQRIGPEAFLDAVAEVRPNLAQELAAGRLVAFDSRPETEQNALQSSVESTGLWSTGGALRTVRVTQTHDPILGWTASVQEGDRRPEDTDRSSYPKMGVAFCPAAQRLLELEPDVRLVRLSWMPRVGPSQDNALAPDGWGAPAGPLRMSVPGTNTIVLDMGTGLVTSIS